MFSFRPSPSLFFGEGKLHQGSSGSRGLWFGQGEGNNTLLNCTSHQGKVNCDHSHADRSILISIHLLPLPVMADAIACAAFGSLPLPISNIYAPLFFSTTGEFTFAVSGRQNQSCSHIVKDWLYGFFCLYKQFSDPHRKKWIHNHRREDGAESSREMRKKRKGVESRGMWAQWVWEAVVYCFTSTVAEINIFMYINSLNRLPHCKATDGRMLFCLLGEPLLNQIEYLKLHSIFSLYQQWVQWPRHSW